MTRSTCLTLAFLVCASGPALPQAASAPVDSAALAVVRTFHEAFMSGDTAALGRVIAGDFVMVEQHFARSRTDMLGMALMIHAAGWQMTFAASDFVATRQGDVAWVHFRRRAEVRPPGQPAEQKEFRESAVLVRGPAGWVLRQYQTAETRPPCPPGL